MFRSPQGCNNDSILQEYDAVSKTNLIQTFQGNGVLKLELGNLLIKIRYQQRGGFFTTVLKI